MKRMTKAHWAGIGRFAEEVRKVLETRGIAVRVVEPFDPKNVDSRFSLSAVAMTKFGRLDITVRDWIATRFELPKEASNGTDCNPYSGKWNLHFNTEQFSAKAPEGIHDYAKECADLFAWRLDGVEAREWTTSPVLVTAAEVDRHSPYHWELRKGMGDEISIEGFDREAAMDWLADQWSEHDSSTSSPEINRAFVSCEDDIKLHFLLRDFARRHPNVDAPDFSVTENTHSL